MKRRLQLVETLLKKMQMQVDKNTLLGVSIFQPCVAASLEGKNGCLSTQWIAWSTSTEDKGLVQDLGVCNQVGRSLDHCIMFPKHCIPPVA